MSSLEPMELAYDAIEPSKGYDASLAPIILLHGLTSAKEVWNNISQSLADATHRKVYRLDARNHGDSEWTELHNYQVMANDVNHFMERQNLPKAVIIGHSMGGRTAMAFATTHPEKTECFISEDISPRTFKPLEKRFPYKYMGLLRDSLELLKPEMNIIEAKELVNEYIYSRMPQEHKSPLDRRGDSSVIPLRKTKDGFQWKTNVDTLERCFLDSLQRPFSLEGRYNGEALFVYGTVSAYDIIKDKELIMEIFPNAVFEAIEGATHLVHLEYPQEFLNAVLKFLEKS